MGRSISSPIWYDSWMDANVSRTITMCEMWTILSQQFHIDAMRPIHFVRIFLQFQFCVCSACPFRVFALISSWARAPNGIECGKKYGFSELNCRWWLYFHMVWLELKTEYAFPFLWKYTFVAIEIISISRISLVSNPTIFYEDSVK